MSGAGAGDGSFVHLSPVGEKLRPGGQGLQHRGTEVLLDLVVTGSHRESGSQRARNRVVWEVTGCQWGSRLDL